MDKSHRSTHGSAIRPGQFGFGDSMRIPERALFLGRRRTAYRIPSMEEPLNTTTTGTAAAAEAAAQQQQSQAGAHAAAARASLSTARRAVIVVCALVGFFFSTMDAAIVATSLITISKDLDGLANQHHWIVIAYLLTYMGFAVFSSQLSDVYGRRDIQLLSWAIFCCFSYGCAESKSMIALIICRAFQGVGGSGLYTLSQVTIAEYGPTHSPPLIGIMIGVTLALALVIGPIVGGLISSRWNWTWIFSINVPFSVATSLALVAAWPLSPGEPSLSSRTLAGLSSIDAIGSGTLLLSVTLLVVGLQGIGSGTLNWDDVSIATSISFAAVTFMLFITWQAILYRGAFTNIRPAFPIQLLSNRVYTAALVVTLLAGYSYFSLMVIIPGRFQVVNGQDALKAGVKLVPMLGATAVGSFIGGAVNSRRNLTFYTVIASTMLLTIGLGVLTMLKGPAQSVMTQYGCQVLIGFAVGLCFSAGTILASLQIPSAMLATSHGVMSQARVLGGCIGIGICAVVFRYDHNAAGGDGETTIVRPSVAYAKGFHENVNIMLYLSAISIFVSMLTLQKSPPQMQTLRSHRLDLNKEEGRGSMSSGGSTELQDMNARRLPDSEERV